NITMIVGNFYVIHCYNNIKEMKKKKLLWICLVFLLIIGGIEILTTCRLEINQFKHLLVNF
ncbi:TPA: hypothetical protein ACHBJA_002638, partial [Enterococcus faecium]